MMKIDLKRESKHLYLPSPKQAVLVDVPEMSFLMIDGAGDPNGSQEFQQAVEALYGVSYTLKFMLKKTGAFPDHAAMPLEGLWWSAKGSESVAIMADKSAWKWTLMIAQSDFVTRANVSEATSQLQRKKNSPAIGKLRFERFHEALCAQIMHIGPFSTEPATIEKLHAFIHERGYRPRGKHHEIYLSDPRRVAPEKMKTVIRHPVESAPPV
jgi:hypothetical protein